MDERFCDVGRGVTLCYETFGDPADPPLLLVMGLGMQMVAWQEDFCELLAGRGFHVVRFDNRDAGRSTHFPGPAPTVRQLLARRFHSDQYRLADMAEDAVGLLRELDLAPAHFVGASMGGMIAQTAAARHPGSVRSLVSIMSTTGSRLRGQPALALYRPLLTPAPTEREAFLDHVERLFTLIGSPGRADVEDLRETASLSYERGRDPAATPRQLAAILASGNRTRELRSITAPTLVIHGTKDRLVSPSGGAATARAIRGARLVRIDGMGHDLPRAFWPRIVDEITDHAQVSERVIAA
ncbi:MAG TPA: alpha/beta hydrolase [Thermoleophilaceae bacterium]|nr:alpha/beta hydrolase [Thermoleophilaceae bacterium]